MEEHGAAAAADASAATSVPAEKHVAIPAAAAAAANGEEDKAAEEDLPPAPALPCGPRKTGLHLFVMNIRCVSSGYLLVRWSIDTIMLVLCC